MKFYGKKQFKEAIICFCLVQKKEIQFVSKVYLGQMSSFEVSGIDCMSLEVGLANRAELLLAGPPSGWPASRQERAVVLVSQLVRELAVDPWCVYETVSTQVLPPIHITL
jgi:hypothetical protein